MKLFRKYKKIDIIIFMVLFLFFFLNLIYIYMRISNRESFLKITLLVKNVYFAGTFICLFYLSIKISKNQISIDKFWSLASIFIITQLIGLKLLNLLYLDNQILLFCLLENLIFQICFIIILCINFYQAKKRELSKKRVIFFIGLLLPPLASSANSFLLEEIVVGATGKRRSIVFNIMMPQTQSIKELQMVASEKLDFFSSMNKLLLLAYSITILIFIVVMGICLLKKKIGILTYLSIPSIFIISQYIGIEWFNGIIRLLPGYNSAALRFPLEILLQNKYLVLYLSFLFIVIIKKKLHTAMFLTYK